MSPFSPLSPIPIKVPPPGEGLWMKAFKHIMSEILRRGSKDLVIKLLWSTTMSVPVQEASEWHSCQNRCGARNPAERESIGDIHPNFSDTFLQFKDDFRKLGYDEERVRLITMVRWNLRVMRSGYGRSTRWRRDG